VPSSILGAVANQGSSAYSDIDNIVMFQVISYTETRDVNLTLTENQIEKVEKLLGIKISD